MSRYGNIQNGIVTDVVEQNSTPTIPGNWIVCGNAGPGWTYNGSTFTAPVVVLIRHISVGAFFDRFASYKYPILASTDVSVQALIKDCSVRQYIDLDNPQLPYGLAMIEGAGFAIDSEAIINDPIQPHELP